MQNLSEEQILAFSNMDDGQVEKEILKMAKSQHIAELKKSENNRKSGQKGR